MDDAGFLEQIVSLLESNGITWCVIGGQGVNAWVEPLVSLDLDVVIATRDLDRAVDLLDVAVPDSAIRLQIQRDLRYASFAERAQIRNVLGLDLPVADLVDILQGKIWAAADPDRRPSKRLKDLTDIARLIEKYPDLRTRVPSDILERIRF